MKLGAGVKVGWRASRLNEVALRTMVASVVCLVASFANVLALVLFNGRERGLVCLTCCTVDVTINVVTIHWVFTHKQRTLKYEYLSHHFLGHFANTGQKDEGNWRRLLNSPKRLESRKLGLSAP